MNEKVHKVKRPFQCREGQFGSGQKLVVGISKNVISIEKGQGKTMHKFSIGKNPKIYQANIDMIFNQGYLWTNSDGKEIFIIPVEYCEQ